MKNNTLLHAFVSVAAMFALTACPGEEENNDNNTNNQTNNDNNTNNENNTNNDNNTNNTNNTTPTNNSNNTNNGNEFGSVTVVDQIADPLNTVVVEEVVSVGPGFIVIHADDNGAPGEVLGNTAVTDGTNADVAVTLSRDVVHEETLYAMLHVDEGTVGEYEFPGPDGPARDANGDVITPGFTALTGVYGSVTVEDQVPSPLNTVVVAEVVSVGPGFIVIHEDDGGAPGAVIGNTAVNDGSNADVSVTLDRDTVPGELLFAMLHVDEGTVGTYEFPGADGPARDANGDVITPAFAAGFAFRTDAWGDYDRADRIGMPAVSTVLAGTLTEADATPTKIAYNSGGPTNDLNGDYATIATDNLAALHGALRDDLMTLPVCATYDDTDPNNPIVDVSTCLSQEVAAGVSVLDLIIPDLIVVNPTASDFPSGRKLTDTVIDTTLTVILLDLANANGAAIDANPDMNDKEFSDTFPYLAAPH